MRFQLQGFDKPNILVMIIEITGAIAMAIDNWMSNPIGDLVTWIASAWMVSGFVVLFVAHWRGDGTDVDFVDFDFFEPSVLLPYEMERLMRIYREIRKAELEFDVENVDASNFWEDGA